jgi:hypothetical protein
MTGGVAQLISRYNPTDFLHLKHLCAEPHFFQVLQELLSSALLAVVYFSGNYCHTEWGSVTCLLLVLMPSYQI